MALFSLGVHKLRSFLTAVGIIIGVAVVVLVVAVGAGSQDILRQFLTEAVVLSVAGGLIGIFLGVVAAEIIARLMDWPVVTSYLVGLAALVISGALGVFFGYFPAHQAARFNPIDALRYE
jgi:putative ABC transport system permease protein